MELIEINDKTLETLDNELITSEVEEVAKFQNDYYKKIGFDKPWIGYFVKNKKQIVGACSFDGVPEKNVVEIFFYTFPEFENKGYATDMVKQLITIAKQQDTNIWISARTEPQENASTKVLKNNDFELVDTVNDPNDGIVWAWRLK